MNTLNRRILAAECSMKIMELLIKSDEQNLPKDLICSLQELIIPHLKSLTMTLMFMRKIAKTSFQKPLVFERI